jgi:hypothetical protein
MVIILAIATSVQHQIVMKNQDEMNIDSGLKLNCITRDKQRTRLRIYPLILAQRVAVQMIQGQSC